jgi:hypothetical protein
MNFETSKPDDIPPAFFEGALPGAIIGYVDRAGMGLESVQLYSDL